MMERSERAATLSFWMLAAFLAILWVAGGASRPDVLGQPIVRFFAWTIVIVAALTFPRVNWRVAIAPMAILGAMSLLVASQLVVLPPSIWTSLPGREIFTEIPVLVGIDQPWRPLSISPSGTSNAMASLTVPVAVLILALNLNSTQHWRIVGLLLGLMVAGTMVAVLQFSEAQFENPFLNRASGVAVSGNFANRNHFALFLSMGCLLALGWAIRPSGSKRNVAIAFVLIPVFVLVILATGSRTGLLLGVLGCAFGAALAHQRLFQELQKLSKRLSIAIAIPPVILLVGAVWLSVVLGRASAIDRAATVVDAAALRGDIWAVTSELVSRYFPAGAGFGTFDPVFRIAEPDAMLNPNYFNHAHNDWLQVLLEGGFAGAVLLFFALAWFVRRSIVVWLLDRGKSRRDLVLAKAGSGVILLTLIASFTDYPARTPMVMATLVLAAVWLSREEQQA